MRSLAEERSQRAVAAAPKPRIGYLCAGGARIGWGHVSRGQALLHALGEGVLLLREGWEEVQHAELGVPLGVFRREDLGSFDVLIVDDYDMDPSGLPLRPGAMLAVVDDWMKLGEGAGLLVNPNVGADASDYPVTGKRTLLCGPEYALLRPQVLAMRHRRSGRASRRILLTLGGSDPEGHTLVAAESLHEALGPIGVGVTVVLGRTYRHAAPELPGLEVVRDPVDFLVRCLDALLVVCAASTTSHEMAFLEVSFVPVSVAENQRRIGEGWRRLRVGTGLSVHDPDWPLRLAAEVRMLVDQEDVRRDRVERARSRVDGHGAARVAAAIRNGMP